MIVLDTHAWIWFISNPDLLSKRAQKAVDAAKLRTRWNYLVEKGYLTWTSG
jgi:PIN domain nuclease of toxin-antitoxin system